MKILQVCVDLDGGGIDRYLLNYCSRIDDIQFDFAVVDSKKGVLEPLLKELGCNIFRVPRQSDSISANYKAIKKIITENGYDAVHVHLGYKGAVALYCAKKCGIKTRIVHAHIAAEPENTKQKALRYLFTALTKLSATHLAACGVDAAKWVWGKSAFKKGKVIIHNNAIETEKYAYCERTRRDVRQELGIEDSTLVVGHVGRLCDQKNQLRLVDIFGKICARNEDSLLVLVGRGDSEDKIRQKIKKMGLQEKVHLMGVRKDVPRLLNAFDVFVFPSTHEGLPFTLIETQCNGLYALSSDAVTEQVRLGDCVEFLPLGVSDSVWAQKAIDISSKGRKADENKVVADAGYDLDVEAKKLREYYFSIVRAN